MRDIEVDHLDPDVRVLVAVDRNLDVVFASPRAAEHFSRAGQPLDGLPLAALFGPAAQSIGRAVLAGRPAAIFINTGVADEPVRVNTAPLANGLTLITLDADEPSGATDATLRGRIRALGKLAQGFRGVEDWAAAARIAETVVGDALAARACIFSLTGSSVAVAQPAGGDRNDRLAVPDWVRTGDSLAIDDLRGVGLLPPADVALFRARGTGALLWVPLVQDGHSVAAMLVEADKPRRWTGDEVGLVASVLDRTDVFGARLDAIAASADAEERCRVLVGAAAAATWEADAGGRVTVPSPTWCALTRQSSDEMLGDGWIDALHVDDRDGARAAWAAAVGSSAPFDVEVRLDDGGRPRWMNLKAAPLRRRGASIAGWVGMVIDISARKRAEEEQKAGETRLRSLMEGIPQLLWRAAPGSGWTWSSPQWCRTTGQTLEESLGAGWLDAVHPDDRIATIERWRAATSEVPFDVEHRIRDVASGRHRWFQTRASAVIDASGQVLEWLGASTDIDELRRLEAEQRHFVAELQHRDRNLMAVVQSIVRQSLTRATSSDAFASALERRLKCLSRVQGILSRGSRSPVALGDLILMELDALVATPARARVSVDGPEVPLQRAAVQILTLAFHELTENALAHGALSADGGSLSVRWAVSERDGVQIVNINWTERMGAGLDARTGPAAPSVTGQGGTRGYGHELLVNALPYSLGAVVGLAMEPTGARCTISLPLGDPRPVQSMGDPRPVQSMGDPRPVQSA